MSGAHMPGDGRELNKAKAKRAELMNEENGYIARGEEVPEDLRNDIAQANQRVMDLTNGGNTASKPATDKDDFLDGKKPFAGDTTACDSCQ